MLAFEKYGIRLTRGDTVRFAIRLRGRVLPGGTKAVFTVKKAPWRHEEDIRKVLTAETLTDGGRLYVTLDAEET